MTRSLGLLVAAAGLLACGGAGERPNDARAQAAVACYPSSCSTSSCACDDQAGEISYYCGGNMNVAITFGASECSSDGCQQTGKTILFTCCGEMCSAGNATGIGSHCYACPAGQVCNGDLNRCEPACVPTPKAQACGAATCGTAPDGCGGTYSCGTCSIGAHMYCGSDKHCHCAAPYKSCGDTIDPAACYRICP